jgi:hypothetical protein
VNPDNGNNLDFALDEVEEYLRVQDPRGARMAKVFRSTFDQLYDGQHTGRYKLSQLYKTEKTHFGTLLEINVQREFEFEDGDVLDYKIAGHEVDCKYSHTGAWMLPQESFNQIILGMKADDAKSRWSAGLVRVTPANRRTSENRDRKTGLNSVGRTQIRWLHDDAPMQPNALLGLLETEVSAIFEQSSGQARINHLFRTAPNQRLSRNIIATVAQQEDYMKRVRENGGSRSALRPEGFLILGGDYRSQREMAIQLGATVPDPGEMISVRVARCDGPGANVVEIGNSYWRIATPQDEVVAAPRLD